MSETQSKKSSPTQDADLEGQPQEETPVAPPTVGDLTAPQQQTYVESEDHRPDITAMSGTLETSGTGGGRHAHLAGVSRVFGNVEAVMEQVEGVALNKMTEMVDEIRGIIHREEASSKTQPVTQQTTENNGVATHEGDVVQNDGTGVPTPAASPETPADQTQAGTADTSADSINQSAPVAEQQTLTGDADDESSSSSARTARKTAAAKKTASSKDNGSDNAKK
jgi:hypothetical protein